MMHVNVCGFQGAKISIWHRQTREGIELQNEQVIHIYSHIHSRVFPHNNVKTF